MRKTTLNPLLTKLFVRAELLIFNPTRANYNRPAPFLPAWMQLEPRNYGEYAMGWSKATGTPPLFYPYGLPRKLDEHDGAFADICF